MTNPSTLIMTGVLTAFSPIANSADVSVENCQSKKIAQAYTRTGAGESLVAPFTSPSTSTTKSYSGLVEVIVSGTGYSYGMTVNDAFFGVKTAKLLDPQYYQLNLGWNGAPLKPYVGESRNIANFIKFVDGIGKANLPTYNSNNRYHFVIEVPKDAGKLSFGVSDGGFDENDGQYNIEIYPINNQLVCNSENNKPDSEAVAKALGCFKDSGSTINDRDLNGVQWIDNSQMTTEKCIEHCKLLGYAYAGTQYSSYCHCGNSYGKYGTASNCNMPCKGNPSQKCGDSWTNSVYKIANPNPNAKQVFINNEAIIKYGDHIVVSYKNKLNRNSKDWIGIYKKGVNNHKQYIDFQYSGNISGRLTFNLAKLGIGEYELRMFAKNGYSTTKAFSSFKVVAP